MARIDVNAQDFIATALAVAAAGPKTEKAIVAAVNRVGQMAFTQVRRKLAETTGIKQKDMSRSRGLVLVPARPGSLVVKIVSRSQHTPLSYFSPSQRKTGVFALPWGQGRIFPGTFMVTLSSGHVGVFRREGSERFRRTSPTTGRSYWSQGKIKELWGPSLAKELVRPPVPELFKQTFQIELPNRMNHEVQRVLGLLKKAA